MEIDRFISTGNSHEICEDYSICVEISDGINLCVVCDGCSCSPNTDVGARILAFSAIEVIKSWVEENGFIVFDKNILAENIMMTALGKLASLTGVPYTVLVNHPTKYWDEFRMLDSTLLMILSNETSAYVYRYGDGAILYSRMGETHSYIRFDSPTTNKGSIPFYPTYLSGFTKSLRMRDSYVSLVGKVAGEKPTMKRWSLKKDEIEPIEHNFDDIMVNDEVPNPLYFELERNGYVLITSDGLYSFFEKGTNKSADFDIIAADTSAFKSTKGKFIQRRMCKLIAKCRKDGIYNYDDVSVAGVLRREDD